MPSPHIFSAILGLSSYWRISAMRMTGQKRHLDITVDVCAGIPFPCPACGGKTVVVSEREESWLNENFFSLRTCIRAALPLVWCERCGEHRVRAPWEQPGSQFIAESGRAKYDVPDATPAVIDGTNG